METVKATPSAMGILNALVMGKDPFSAERLPPDSVMHRAEVMRALLAACVALEASVARSQRRAYLPARVGESWTKEEDEKLVRRFQAGVTTEQLASEHERSIRAVELRLEDLGETQSAPGTTEKRRLFAPRAPKTAGEGTTATARNRTAKR